MISSTLSGTWSRAWRSSRGRARRHRRSPDAAWMESFEVESNELHGNSKYTLLGEPTLEFHRPRSGGSAPILHAPSLAQFALAVAQRGQLRFLIANCFAYRCTWSCCPATRFKLDRFSRIRSWSWNSASIERCACPNPAIGRRDVALLIENRLYLRPRLLTERLFCSSSTESPGSGSRSRRSDRRCTLRSPRTCR